MNNERFMKHYVKVVNSTLTESVLRNVDLQANANFVDELIGELNTENESLKKQIQEMGEDIQKVLSERDATLSSKQKEIDEFNRTKSEIDNVRHQVQHLDTFRNQLVQANKTIEEQNVEINNVRHQVQQLDTFRNQLVQANKTIEEQNVEIERLKKTIEDLQAPPKRKKAIALPKALETFIEPETVQDTSVKDGGTF